MNPGPLALKADALSTILQPPSHWARRNDYNLLFWCSFLGTCEFLVGIFWPCRFGIFGAVASASQIGVVESGLLLPQKIANGPF